MNDELQQQLYDDYPELFRLVDRAPGTFEHGTPPVALFGCQCGDGWYDLLDDLCEIVQREARLAGDDESVDVEIHQIKEKFGGLRFYHGGAPQGVLGAIRLAERRSRSICEECGATDGTDVHRDGGWLRTRCSDCRQTHKERLDEYMANRGADDE